MSVIGVYDGAVGPMPMIDVVDKQLTLRFGQANVRRWVDYLMPLVSDQSDPLGVLDLRTHRLPLAQAPGAYAMVQRTEEGSSRSSSTRRREQGMIAPSDGQVAKAPGAR